MEIFQREMPLNEADPNNLLMHINKSLERIAGLSSLTINDFKQAIMSDSVLFNALKGVSGDTIQNYGDSLLKNGALELGTLEGWSSGQLGVIYEGVQSFIPTIKSTNQNVFFVDKNYLYKVQYNGKSTADTTLFVVIDKLDDSNNILPTQIYSHVPLDTLFGKCSYYFGGVGNHINAFHALQTKCRVSIEKNNPLGECQINSLIITKIDLGEPVPFNLPYLPVGQMVFDATDGSVGRYDGTTIHWFAIA